MRSYLMTPGTCAGSPGVIHCRWDPSECRASVITRRSLAQRAYGKAGYGF
jgi:hypothetical protein